MYQLKENVFHPVFLNILKLNIHTSPYFMCRFSGFNSVLVCEKNREMGYANSLGTTNPQYTVAVC